MPIRNDILYTLLIGLACLLILDIKISEVKGSDEKRSKLDIEVDVETGKYKKTILRFVAKFFGLMILRSKKIILYIILL